jgi:hypothetical protein
MMPLLSCRSEAGDATAGHTRSGIPRRPPSRIELFWTAKAIAVSPSAWTSTAVSARTWHYDLRAGALCRARPDAGLPTPRDHARTQTGSRSGTIRDKSLRICDE